RTRATIARERGLEPLADLMRDPAQTGGSPESLAAAFVDPEKDVADVEAALAGARDIVAEGVSDSAEVREKVREYTRKHAMLVSVAKDSAAQSDYEMYYDFREPVSKIVPHRILAINRGEREKILSVSVEVDSDRVIADIEKMVIENPRSIFAEMLRLAVSDSYKRLIAPSIEREVRSELTDGADEHAISTFATNLKNLLLQAPVAGKMIMGIDPGFRTGCKVAIIDETGKYLEGETIFPHPPQNRVFDAKDTLRDMIERHRVDIIAIGNGTASRETESMTAELIGELKAEGLDRELFYIIVNEAGASVYSASKVAKQEFPDLDASMRGNISIARRLMDPLAELVKIDPKHIGVGLYQHDVNQKSLEGALHNVVESAVNRVGVDLNTASASLLKYVAGLTSRTAENIVKFRDEKGKFRRREDLQSVTGVGEIAFQQAAGFLRIPDGENLLDNTGIHPESYQATRKLLKRFRLEEDHGAWRQLKQLIRQEKISLSSLAQEVGVGEPTLEDILADLEKPGRDPREEMPAPILKSDVLKIEDLKEGMVLKGTVRNVVDFGAFVDIGVKRDGLVHISEMANRFIKNPHEVVGVGDVVSVRVVSVDHERGRVQLSMKV
ncbi:MAG TPA: Tex family protein, partial [Calditrichia bacterium]|nr:Tex family protein [Calditrichia bacterium]